MIAIRDGGGRTGYVDSGDTPPIGAPFAEDVVWDVSEVELPDIGNKPLHGREAVRRYWATWLAPWEDITFDYELVESGDSVVALLNQSMRSRDGLELGPVRYAQVWTFEDGEVTHWKLYRDPDAALKAAGLSGPDRAA